MRLSPIRLGFALGATWGLAVFAVTLIAIAQGQTDLFFELLKIYPGYELTLRGAALGFLWAFIDGFFGGYVLAWLYNGFGGNKGRTACCSADRCKDCHACNDCGQMSCSVCDSCCGVEKKDKKPAEKKKKTTTKAAAAKTTTKKKAAAKKKTTAKKK